MLRFGSVAVDVPAREVTVDGALQHLEPQAFDLLVYLLEHRDRVVPKSELLDEVWGDQFVSESALTTRIKEVRRAVGDDGRAQLVVKNVRGRGYRFVATITPGESVGDGGGGTREGGAGPPSALVGREPEIEQIERTLVGGRIVSLIGPGGVGKTSLATAIARRVEEAIVVDLASVSDGSGVLPAWRQAAGLVGPFADETASLEAFATSGALAVLDNCEHVVGRVAELLQTFTETRGDGRVLATSRERLGVPGESVIPIQPLAIDDARTVFVDRAARVRPDFSLSPNDLDDLDALLESVDRLPLAIEMAAGRVGAMTIADLRAAIADSATLLSSSQRHPTARHRSITDVVAWSEGLLAPSERSILWGFSAFAGPVGVDDAVGVLADDGRDRAEVLDAIAALVDRSLVVADVSGSTTRYRLLETTKAYARQHGDAVFSARHAAWFAEQAALARRLLNTDRELEGHRRFTELLPEFRVAHAWARDHDPGVAVDITAGLSRWAHDRLRGEPARWGEQLLALLPEGGREWSDVSGFVAGDLAHRAEYDAAEQYADRALSNGGATARMLALDALGNVMLYRGELERLHECASRLADEAAEHDHGGALVQATIGRSLAHTYAGDSSAGRTVVESFAPSPESPSDQGWLAYGLAESMAIDDPAAAIHEYRRAIDLAEQVGAELLLSVSRVSLAAAMARAGDPDVASVEFRSMLRGFQRTANLTHAITAVRNVTLFLARTGRDRAAMELLGALSGDRVKATYGAEQEDLEACRATVEEREGGDAVAQWIEAGRGWGPRGAVQAALDALD